MHLIEEHLCINIYSKYIQYILTGKKREISNNTTIVRDSNTPLTLMDRSTRQKISKEVVV